MEKDLERDSESDREPVKLLEDGVDMVKRGGSGDDAGCRVLDQLKLMKGFVRGTEKEEVTVIDAGGDEAVDQDSCGVRRERGVETIKVTEMEICRPGNVIDVKVENKVCCRGRHPDS